MDDMILPGEVQPMISSVDLADAVRSTAILADLTMTMWHADKTDKKVSNKVKVDANAVGNTGHYVKHILAGADGPYKACKSAYSAARTAHYNLTLPWVTNPAADRATGPRLLPNLLFDRYINEMSALRSAAVAARDAFIDVYPDLVDRAQANLGELANPLDYPTPVAVEAAWRLSFDFLPIPDAASFRGLPDAVLSSLGSKLTQRQEQAVATSQGAMWERVKETVGHLVERLTDMDARFHATTVEAVRSLITLLPGFDVAGDPRVTTVVADIQYMLEGVDAVAIRKNPAMRTEVLEQAKRINDRLSQWGL